MSALRVGAGGSAAAVVALSGVDFGRGPDAAPSLHPSANTGSVVVFRQQCPGGSFTVKKLECSKQARGAVE